MSRLTRHTFSVNPVFVNPVFANVLFAIVAVLLMAGNAAAQDRRQNQPGKFDFYVLSLAWAPSFCAAAFERAPDQAPPPECGQRAYPFVVHGLWPQYEKGFPELCRQ